MSLSINELRAKLQGIFPRNKIKDAQVEGIIGLYIEITHKPTPPPLRQRWYRWLLRLAAYLRKQAGA